MAREGRFDTRRDCHASLGMTGSFDRLRTNGGRWAQRDCHVAVPLGMTGSFDKLRTNGGFALTPALSHRGRGDVLRQAQDERGVRPHPSPLPSRERGCPSTGSGRTGGSPSPQPSPIAGLFDRGLQGAVRDSRGLRMNGGGCQYLRRKGAGTPRICFRTTDQTSAIAARTDAVSRPMIFTPTPLLSGSVVTPARTWG